MAMLEREEIRSLVSDSAGLPSAADYACTGLQPETRLQEELFSDVISSVCYWSTVILLALAGAGLLYWRAQARRLRCAAGWRSVWSNDTSLDDALPAADRRRGLSQPRGVVCGARQACLENADDGSQSHRGHECDHSARNIPDCAVARTDRKPDHFQFVNEVRL